MSYPETAALAKAAREATGLSPSEFATMIRAGKRTVYNWESGIKPPTPTVQLMLEEIVAGWRPGQAVPART